MLGALAIVGVLAPVAAQYVSPFTLRDPDVYFNLSIPTVSPFFVYRGNWSDGGQEGPTTIGPSSNISFYAAGTAAWVYARRGPGSSSPGPPGSMIGFAGRINGSDLGDGRWVFPYRTKKMTYTFALVDSVPQGDSLLLDSVTIESGMYTEATSWEDVHCVTEPFTKNASLPLSFQGGAWTFGDDAQSAWGGAVIAPLPQNTSFVWVNATTVTGATSATLNIFMSHGINPLNFQQLTLNSARSYTAKDVIVHQAPLDPTDQYTLTLSSPGNNLMILNSITYCSYYKDGKFPIAKKKSNAGLIGGLVGGILGGLLLLGLLGFALWRCRRKRRRSSYEERHSLKSDTSSPDAFVVDESAAVQPVPDKRMLGSMAVPRSGSPTELGADSADFNAEYEAKLNVLANGGSRGNSRTMSSDSAFNTLSGDRTMSGDSYRSGSRGMSADSTMTGSTERQKPLDSDGQPRRPRRPRRTRHVVEHAEDGGEVRVEHEEEVVVEVLPPQYRPEWEEQRRATADSAGQQQ